jgi:hypothetical protein
MRGVCRPVSCAQALGIHRNTAWTIVKNKHKLGRLSAKTIDRILNNPDTPPSVRAIVQQYASARAVTGYKKSNQTHGRCLIAAIENKRWPTV